MKKTIIAVVLILAVLYFVGLYSENGAFLSGGSSINVKYYKTATNSAATCSGATSTLILAAAARQDTRNAFYLTVSSTDITLCRAASGCQVGQGEEVNSGGRFVQEDAYYGAYSCIGNGGASSTIGLSYSQS